MGSSMGVTWDSQSNELFFDQRCQFAAVELSRVGGVNASVGSRDKFYKFL